MDIGKIQFGQLSQTKDIEKSFEDLDVNSDGVISEEDKALAGESQAIASAIANLLTETDEEESVDILGDFVDDTAQMPDNTDNSTANPQAVIALGMVEINKLNDEQKKLAEEIEVKEKELKDFQKEIENKQEEYDTLATQAKNNNDNSKLAQLEDLRTEIKSLSNDLTSLNSAISALQNQYNANSARLTSFSANLQIQQNNLTESVANSNAATTVEGVTAADAVGEVSEVSAVADVTEVGETPQTLAATNKKELKSMAEYAKILDCKFEEVASQVGYDRQAIWQYVDNNPLEFADITGDGKIDKIDLQILINYCSMMPTLASPEAETNGRDWVTAKRAFASRVKLKAHVSSYVSHLDANRYDLTDVENYVKLGGNARDLRDNLSISGIVKEEDWEAKYASYFPDDYKLYYQFAEKNRPYSDTVMHRLKLAEEYVSKCPENAGLAGIAASYMDLMGRNWDTDAQRLANNGGIGVMVEDGLRIENKTYTDESAIKGWLMGQNWDDQNFLNLCSSDFDMNGDGVINAKDLTDVSCDVDLDGDGEITSSERSYMTRVKNHLKKLLEKEYATKGLHNLLTIDDVIDSTEVYDQTWVNSVSSRAKNIYEWCREMTSDSCPFDVSTEWVEAALGRIGFANKNIYTHYADGTGGVSEAQVFASTGSIQDIDLVKLFEGCMNFLKPANAYLHYVNSANLSKTELQAILDKINAASSFSQSELAEVKKAVEAKLANME